MDLHDFEAGDLYFSEPVPDKVRQLLEIAAREYPGSTATAALDSAAKQAPSNLMVLVARYRYYYYQHQLALARDIAARALEVCADQLTLPEAWSSLSRTQFEGAFQRSPVLSRFYLQALKGLAYLSFRLGDVSTANEALTKLLSLDDRDRMGARMLFNLLPSRKQAERDNPQETHA